MGFAEAGVCLMQGVCLIWGPLNTGFTVYEIETDGHRQKLTSGAIDEMCKTSPGTERMLSINRLLRLSEKLLRISGLKKKLKL